MMASNIALERNSYGRLCLVLADGTRYEGITPVRAFPIQAPLEAVSLVGSDGKEVYWLDHMDELPAPMRALLDEEFQAREFVPEIHRIDAIDAISVPSAWTVQTDRGSTVLTLKAEEDIRKLEGRHHLLISGRDGVQYRIRDARLLDKGSQKFLERFL